MLINDKFHCESYDKTVTHASDCVNCPLYDTCNQRIGGEGIFLWIFFMLAILFTFLFVVFLLH